MIKYAENLLDTFTEITSRSIIAAILLPSRELGIPVLCPFFRIIEERTLSTTGIERRDQ